MFMDDREGRALRMKTFMIAIEAAQRAGMGKETLDSSTKLVFHRRKEVLRRALTGESPALVEPLRVTLKLDADSSRVKVILRPMPPDNEE